MADESTKVLIYARVSSDRQAKEGNGIEDQTENLKQVARQKGFTITEDPITDEGETGTNFERPGIKRVEEISEQKDISHLLVDDIDRVGRDAAETIFYIYRLRDLYGITLITTSGQEFDIDDSDDLLHIAFKAISSQMENENRSRRAFSGMIQKFERKNWSTFFNKAPYGYSLTEDDWLEIDQDEAQVVREIFATFLASDLDRPYRRTFEQARGVPEDTDYTKVRRILKRPLYIGEPTVNASRRGTHSESPSKTTVADKSLKILDEETFEQAQKKVEAVHERHSGSESDGGEVHEFAREFGITTLKDIISVIGVVCPDCETKMVKNGRRTTGGREVYNYKCSNDACGRQRKFPTEEELSELSEEE